MVSMHTTHAVVIEGDRFDVDKVVSAYRCLLAAFGAAFPGRNLVDVPVHGGFRRLHWDAGGESQAAQYWFHAHAEVDAANERLFHSVGQMSVVAYLLGDAWCTRRGDGLAGPGKDYLLKLDVTPVVRVHGEELHGAAHVSVEPSSQDLSIVDEIVTRDLAPLGLAFTVKEEPSLQSGTVVPRRFGLVSFPHASFGAGRGTIRVRCLPPAGIGTHRDTPRGDN